VVPRAGLGVCGKYCPIGIRSLDLPTRRESLYLLRRPGTSMIMMVMTMIMRDGDDVSL
jgi:hypothetical protein